MDKANILYIDDERANLNTFKANFRKEYNLFLTDSANEATSILEENSIEVIIADQRMPELTGVEFFGSIKDRFPNPIRIILTGYADIKATVAAINEGQVFRYIDKPWQKEEVKKAIDEALKLQHLKQQKEKEMDFFVYRATHDLRSPLSSLSGLLEILKSEVEDPQAATGYIGHMEKAIGKLNRTLEDLIASQKIAQSRSKKEDVVAKELVDDIISGMSFEERFQKVKIVTEIAPDLTAYTDRSILESILQNLIQNAIQYAKLECAEPYVKVSITGEDGKATRYTVEDNGLGMSDEEQENVFQMFFRGSSSLINPSGSGLGLYIVKMGTDKLGMTLNLESRKGIGSKFELIVPGDS